MFVILEPKCYSLVVKHKERVDVMNKDIEALEKNNKWKLATLLKGKKAVQMGL